MSDADERSDRYGSPTGTMRQQFFTMARPFDVFVLACVAAFLVVAPLYAVQVTGPTTTVVPDIAGVSATYTWSQYRTTGNESVVGFSVTFPEGADVSGATSQGQPGTVTVSGQTVTVMFNTRITRNTTFDLSLGGIVNPPAGTYPVGEITMYVADRNGNDAIPSAFASGEYTIVPNTSFLTLTITTPDAGQNVEFGDVSPGATTPPQTVLVEVDSSAPYLMSRSIGGQFAELGLNVSGGADGAKPSGSMTYSEAYELTPPWTTDPGPYSATVLYTVVQD